MTDCYVAVTAHYANNVNPFTAELLWLWLVTKILATDAKKHWNVQICI